EYRAYEERARALLIKPRARAAILHGGIVWRIALELLRSDAIGCATAGPSEECHVYGHEFLAPSRQDPLYDDHLTPDELSVICGVYSIPNREHSGDHKGLASWWPSPTHWDKSLRNYGFWTADNEVWFRNRLDMIRSNEGHPLTANRWKNGLMFHKGGLPFYRAHEQYCNRIIDVVFPVP
ncbi:hypothetical protein C8Q76DRAFT_576504, partial [Earliella scabrosa]